MHLCPDRGAEARPDPWAGCSVCQLQESKLEFRVQSSSSWFYYLRLHIMAELPIFRHTCFSLLVVLAVALFSKPTSSLTFPRTLTNNPNFDSETALFGDAEVVVNNGPPCVKLTRPSTLSTGLLIRTEPFKFVNADRISFSTEFSFSISLGSRSGDGEGLALVFVPGGSWSKWSTVGGGSFALSKDNKFMGVGINVNEVVSSLNNGDKLKSWIDYDASWKRLEVRLNKSGDTRPSNPIFAHGVDLARMWRDEEMRVGIASRNVNSTQSTTIYSWRFRMRKFPNSMHSLPADPRAFAVKKGGGELVRKGKRKICPLTVMGGLILATACGALVAFVALFLWVIFANRHVAKCPVYAVDFGYEKVDVVVQKNSDGLKG